MAVQGPFTLFDRGLLKLNGTVDLTGHTLKAILCGNSQTISRSFTGSSGDARYADITGELTTASGYTAGGVALTSQATSRISTTVNRFICSAIQWTLTGTITIKYLIIYDDTSTNKDLVCFFDYDTTSTSSTILASTGLLLANPDATNGIFTWTQP
jgi:hypothetical protein